MTDSTPASEFAADTLAVVLRLENRRLGARARSIFAAVESGQAHLHVPAMVFAEIMYLSEKGRIEASLSDMADYWTLLWCNRRPRSPMCLSFTTASSPGQRACWTWS